MFSLKRYLQALVLAALVLTPATLMATWPLDGSPICTDPSTNYANSVSVEDGSGGAIFIWYDDRNGDNDIFAQRIDHDGNPLWTTDGVPVCTISGDQTMVQAVPDGDGGAIITWADSRGGPSNIYCQRIDSDGTRLWPLSGIAICTALNSQDTPVITTDGAGGAIIAWFDDRAGTNDIYAQRIDMEGKVHWPTSGEAICTHATVEYDLQIASNGEGGAYIAWMDGRDQSYDIFCELINFNGSVTYGNDGMGICTNSSDQFDPRLIALDPGYAILAWHDIRNGISDLYGTLLSDLTPTWTADGILIASHIAGYALKAVKDDDDCIVFCAPSYRDGEYRIFAQRLFMTGVPLWPITGVAVCDAPGRQTIPEIISDGTGGTLVFWLHDNGMYGTARGQRLDGEGNRLWSPEGTELCHLPISQMHQTAVPDGEGGAITAWQDYRTGGPGIYAQKIDRHGYIGSPEPMIGEVSDVPMDQGGKVELTWDASYLDPYPEQEITYYSIWKSLSPASAMMMENEIEYTDLQALTPEADSEPGTPSGMIIRREVLGATTYYWELLETQTAQYYEGYSKVLETDFTSMETAWTWSYYQVAAHTGDPLVVWTSQPDSGYSLDNLAPAAPVGLAGEQYYSPEGMDLIWNKNTEEDISHYVIYRGIYPTFIPNATSYLTSAFDTLYFDGSWNWDDGYVYKVSAIDIHGNESGYALLLPGQVTGDDPPTPAHSDYLSQNWPNPFNPSTTIQFGLKESGHVQLSIYDASGRLVSELINSTMPAGNYSEIWNGTNSAGAYVASGIYFYRLDAGEFSMKKKMVLLR